MESANGCLLAAFPRLAFSCLSFLLSPHLPYSPLSSFRFSKGPILSSHLPCLSLHSSLPLHSFSSTPFPHPFSSLHIYLLSSLVLSPPISFLNSFPFPSSTLIPLLPLALSFFIFPPFAIPSLSSPLLPPLLPLFCLTLKHNPRRNRLQNRRVR